MQHLENSGTPVLYIGRTVLNLLAPEFIHLNFSTLCMQNVNNTGTKKGSVMK